MMASRSLQKFHLIGQNRDLAARCAIDRYKPRPKTSKKWRGCTESQVIILLSGVWILQAITAVID
jgi:hypothetical protein